MPGSDQLIHDYCRKQDQKSFQRFFDLHAQKLWRVLVGRGCHPDAAYDLVAEAFLRFSTVCCNEKAVAVPLLFRIAFNLRIDAYRHEQASPLLPWDESAESVAAPVTEEAENSIWLRQILRSLDQSEQNLLLMRYWIGMTHKEIAQTLELPEGTVRRQSAALIAQLQARWGEKP